MGATTNKFFFAKKNDQRKPEMFYITFDCLAIIWTRPTPVQTSTFRLAFKALGGTMKVQWHSEEMQIGYTEESITHRVYQNTVHHTAHLACSTTGQYCHLHTTVRDLKQNVLPLRSELGNFRTESRRVTAALTCLVYRHVRHGFSLDFPDED
jgi:hypothetical protein